MSGSSSSTNTTFTTTSSSSPTLIPLALGHQYLTTLYVPICIFFITVRDRLYSLKSLHLQHKTFLKTHITPLLKEFTISQCKNMPGDKFKAAKEQLAALIKQVIGLTSVESIVSKFNGGMNEGSSYGLRRWFSTNSGGSITAAAMEEAMGTLHSSPLPAYSGEQMQNLQRVCGDIARAVERIPSGYRMKSSAHPHLPFFGRIDVARKAVAGWDPTDDEVMIVDNTAQAKEVFIIDEEEKKVTEKSKVKGAKKAVESAASQPLVVAIVEEACAIDFPKEALAAPVAVPAGPLLPPLPTVPALPTVPCAGGVGEKKKREGEEEGGGGKRVKEAVIPVVEAGTDTDSDVVFVSRTTKEGERWMCLTCDMGNEEEGGEGVHRCRRCKTRKGEDDSIII